MDEAGKQNQGQGSHDSNDPPPSDNSEREEAVGSYANEFGTITTIPMDGNSGPDEKALRCSLESLQTLSHKFSRSYLVPYTAHLLELLRKGRSRRDMLRWLLQEHHVKSNLSTLSYFLRKAVEEERRVKRIQGVGATLGANKSACAVKVAQTLHAPTIHPPESSSKGQAAEAIRAVKERAKLAKLSGDKPKFVLDDDKPLLGKPPAKQN